MNANANSEIKNQDEIALDDLFGQIEALDNTDAVTSEKPVEDEFGLDSLDGEIDGLDELNLETLNVEPKESEKTSPSKKTKAKKTDEKSVKEEKPIEKPRTTYSNSKVSDMLMSRLNGNLSEIVLEFSDAELSPDDLAAKQQDFLNLLNTKPNMSKDGSSTQVKVAQKVVILFSFFASGGKWNEVMYRTFKLLLKDGKITSGKDGSLVKELLSKPYSKGTANAQAGQMFQMLPLLKIATKTDANTYTINEESTIVARLREQYFPDIKAS